MVTAITTIGTANPPYKRTQQEASDFMCANFNLSQTEKRILKSVYKATCIEYRHSVIADYCKKAGDFTFFPNHPDAPFPTTADRMKIFKDNAPDLALAAIHDCISQQDEFDIKQITHIITVSCTGMYAPGLDIEIIQKLNLKSSIKRTAINFMGCYGAFNALKVADAICQADNTATVLIVCIEICTIHFQKKMNLDNILANSVFSDGSAAMVVQSKPKQNKYLSLESFHCDILPNASQAMTWHIADTGFDIVLSSYIPELLQSGISNFTNTLLNQYNLKSTNIDFYAIHPGGLKILEACEEALSITKEYNHYSYHILKQFGNMSSATVPFVLKTIWNDMSNKDHGKNIFSCAFGPGLTLESMLLRTVCQ